MQRPVHSAARVVRTYYALTGLFTLSASFIWGINTLFLLDAGLSIFEAFAANAAFTAGMVLFEIPTGVIADTRGRRLSFLLSAATLTVGTLAYVGLAQIGAAFVWWAAASIGLGLGFTFYSGAVEAWFVDALATAGGDMDLDPYFARGGQIFGAATLVGTITGGLVGDIDLALPFLLRAVLLAALFVVGWVFMHDEGFTTRPFRLRAVPREVADVARASWRHGLRNRPVRLLMILSFLQMGFLIWGWYAWQPYFLQLLGQDLIWVAGVIAALVALMMILGNQVVRWIDGRVGRPTLLVAGSAWLAASMVGVGLVDSFYPAVGLFLVGMLAFGVLGPTKQSALHRLIPSRQRATIVSFDGLLGSAGGVGSQLALARIAEERGYGAGYVVGGAVLALGVPVAWLFAKVRPAPDERGGPPERAIMGTSTPVQPDVPVPARE